MLHINTSLINTLYFKAGELLYVRVDEMFGWMKWRTQTVGIHPKALHILYWSPYVRVCFKENASLHISNSTLQLCGGWPKTNRGVKKLIYRETSEWPFFFCFNLITQHTLIIITEQIHFHHCTCPVITAHVVHHALHVQTSPALCAT